MDVIRVSNSNLPRILHCFRYDRLLAQVSPLTGGTQRKGQVKGRMRRKGQMTNIGSSGGGEM